MSADGALYGDLADCSRGSSPSANDRSFSGNDRCFSVMAGLRAGHQPERTPCRDEVAARHPSPRLTIGQSNEHIHQSRPFVDSRSEWNEAENTIGFAVEDRPAQHCMSRRILDRIKFAAGDFNPDIGTVSISGSPPLHPGASRCFVCLAILLRNPGPHRPAEPFTRHSCFIQLRPIIPPRIDHAAVSHCATHRAGRTRNLEASEPVSELPVGVRRRSRMRGSTNESRIYYPGRTHPASDQGTPVPLTLRAEPSTTPDPNA